MLDALAFDTAYRKYGRALTGVTRKVTDNNADAEDVAQEAWLEAWKARDSLDRVGVWAWLCRVVRRLWWQRLNRAGKKRDGVAVPIENAVNVVTDGGQERAVADTQVRDAIGSMMVPAGRGGRGIRAAPASMIETARLVLAGQDAGEIGHFRKVTRQAVEDTMNKVMAALRRKWGIVA